MMNIDFRTMTTDEITYLRRQCNKELERRDSDELMYLGYEIEKTNNKYLMYLYEAMEHTHNRVEPKTPRLGYELANMEYTAEFSEIFESPELITLYAKLCALFDVTNYIFATTHYDECTSYTHLGQTRTRYFRRS